MLFSGLLLVRFSVLFLHFSAAAMLFSRLVVLVRVSVLVLPISGAVMLFSRLVRIRFSVFLTCLYAVMDV